MCVEMSSLKTSGTDTDTDETELVEKWRRVQEQLVKKLVLKDALVNANSLSDITAVGGFDISFVKESHQACAAFTVLEYPSLRLLYKDCKRVTVSEPYVAGFLAFREVNHLVDLYQRYEKSVNNTQANTLIPQISLVDGNGILHPKGFGLACHLGVLLDIPTIGIGKSLLHIDGLTKEYVKGLWNGRNSPSTCTCVKLKGKSGRVWGAALKSTAETNNPIFISQGHRISLESAIQITQRCCRFRVPEPVRQADTISRKWLRDFNLNQ
mmetsp:Transcript_15391/g.19050  ORF Transcript_15391/g.19050 Transcript_15391/m.19050 type:complete len:267 (+) Transcript_15391:131-931(+)